VTGEATKVDEATRTVQVLTEDGPILVQVPRAALEDLAPGDRRLVDPAASPGGGQGSGAGRSEAPMR
jgi:hypothetical protein